MEEHVGERLPDIALPKKCGCQAKEGGPLWAEQQLDEKYAGIYDEQIFDNRSYPREKCSISFVITHTCTFELSDFPVFNCNCSVKVFSDYLKTFHLQSIHLGHPYFT